ncbi:MAG: efflux RND transporter periplasmic adaptor subunit [Saprospiraceae bacterium]
MKNNKYILFIGIFLFMTQFWACRQNNEEPIQAPSPETTNDLVSLTQEQLNMIEIQTDSLRMESVQHVLNLRGHIVTAPDQKMSIHSPISGYIKSIKWLPGMWVEKGSPLVQIEDLAIIQLQQEYLKARDELLYAEKEFNRQKDIFDKQAGSEKVYFKSEENMQLKKIEVKALSEKLKLLNILPSSLDSKTLGRSISIFAPFSGYIFSVDVNRGQYIDPTKEMLTLVSDQQVLLQLKVFEKDIPLIKKRQKIKAFLPNMPTSSWNGVVTEKGINVDEKGQTDVYCTLDVEDKSLMTTGSFMTAEVVANHKLMYVIDEKAVVQFDKKSFVFIKNKATEFQMIEVAQGRSRNNKTEILNGDVLKDKVIVTTGAYTLLMKLKNIED